MAEPDYLACGSGSCDAVGAAAERIRRADDRVRYALTRRDGRPVRAAGARSSTDRASDYGSEGWGFESLRARSLRQRPPGPDQQQCRSGPSWFCSRPDSRAALPGANLGAIRQKGISETCGASPLPAIAGDPPRVAEPVLVLAQMVVLAALVVAVIAAIVTTLRRLPNTIDSAPLPVHLPSTSRGDAQAVLEAFGTGGRAVLQHSRTAEAAPADVLGTRGSIRPFSRIAGGRRPLLRERLARHPHRGRRRRRLVLHPRAGCGHPGPPGDRLHTRRGTARDDAHRRQAVLRPGRLRTGGGVLRPARTADGARRPDRGEPHSRGERHGSRGPLPGRDHVHDRAVTDSGGRRSARVRISTCMQQRRQERADSRPTQVMHGTSALVRATGV